jgi:hypothetical protein
MQRVVEGGSIGDIAAQEHVSAATVKRDLRALAKENVRQLRGLSAEALGAELVARSQDRVRRLYQLYDRTASEAIQIGCLDHLRREDHDLLQILQRLGLVHEAPARVLHDIRLIHALQALSVEERRELEAADDDEEFRRLLLTKTGLEVLPGERD